MYSIILALELTFKQRLFIFLAGERGDAVRFPPFVLLLLHSSFWYNLYSPHLIFIEFYGEMLCKKTGDISRLFMDVSVACAGGRLGTNRSVREACGRRKR